MRRGLADNPFRKWQMVLLVLAVAVWVGGIIAKVPDMAWVAIALAVAGKILGMLGRRMVRQDAAVVEAGEVVESTGPDGS